MATLPCVEDSCSLNLEINSNNQLTGDVNLDPHGGIVCNPGAGLAVNLGPDGCGVDLSINAANELVADLDLRDNSLICDSNGLGVRLDPSACNAIENTSSGLIVKDHDSRLISSGNATAVGFCATSTLLGIDIDPLCLRFFGGSAFQQVSGAAVVSYTNTTCRVVNVEYRIGIGPQRYAVSNGWALAIGAHYTITAPAINGGLPYTSSIGFTELDASDSPLVAGQVLRATYPNHFAYGATFLNPGQSITLSAHAVAAALSQGSGPAAMSLFFGASTWLGVFTRD
jgi:hypothetical protein